MRYGLLVVLTCACGGSHPNRPDASVSADSSDGSTIDGATSDAAVHGPTIARSGSRLKLAWYQTNDGVRVPTSNDEFYDSSRDELCRLWYLSDGLRHCTPLPTTNPTLFYADSACTMPVFKGPITIQYAYENSPTGTGCTNQSTIAHLYKAGALITPPTTLW